MVDENGDRALKGLGREAFDLDVGILAKHDFGKLHAAPSTVEMFWMVEKLYVRTASLASLVRTESFATQIHTSNFPRPTRIAIHSGDVLRDHIYWIPSGRATFLDEKIGFSVSFIARHVESKRGALWIDK